MKKIVATGKTIEEAIKAGLNQLQATEEQVTIEILEQPSKGLFGLIGAKEAKVAIEVKSAPIDETVSFLQEVFQAMNIDVRIEKQKHQDQFQLNLSGDEIGILIGRRGQTLDALQYLVNIVASRFSNTHLRIILDAENFRDRRKQTLEELSDRLARKVIKTRREVILEPMSPQERKIIHSKLQDHEWVRTYSKGEEPNRKVVIALK